MEHSHSYSDRVLGAAEILQHAKVRSTPIRIQVLELLGSSANAWSQPDLEKNLVEVDRVTLYRTLHTFEESGIVHRFVDPHGVGRYALCTHSCEGPTHQHEHLHFECASCGKHFCLDEVRVPQVYLPQGFVMQEIRLLATGICSQCSSAPGHS
jgi:Fur family ferric uptake transcriptional regulator